MLGQRSVMRYTHGRGLRAREVNMTDRYTKGVLTIIALALIVIAGEHLIPRATADDVSRVVICDVNGVVCADVIPGQSGITDASGSLAVASH